MLRGISRLVKVWVVFFVFVFLSFLFVGFEGRAEVKEVKKEVSVKDSSQVKDSQGSNQRNDQKDDQGSNQGSKGSNQGSGKGGKECGKKSIPVRVVGKSQEKESDEKSKSKVKLEEIRESVFPLSPDEVRVIREESEKIKKILEEERKRKGKTIVFYYDFFEIPKINVAVNYSTTVCFWDKIDEDGGVVVGSENFEVQVVENEKCISIFPKSQFKESNVAVFIKGQPIHLIMREVYDEKDIDINVVFREKPNISDIELLRRIATKDLSVDLQILLRKKELSEEEKRMGVKEKFFFDGQKKYIVYVIPREKANENFSSLKRMCLNENCYVVKDCF